MVQRYINYLVLVTAMLFKAGLAAEMSSGDQDFLAQAEVNLVLQPSSSKIQALTVYVEAPGVLDLSELTYSSSSSDDGVWVEYAVVPVEFMKAITTIGHGQCDETGCDFTPDTDWILDMGVGSKVDGEYAWCSKDKKDNNSFIPGWHLIRDDSILKQTGSNRYGAVKAVQNPPLNPRYQNVIHVRDASESGYYAILFANCQETNGQEVKVEGTLVWNAQDDTELSPFRAILAPVLLVSILAAVYYTKEKEGRAISSEDAYNNSARNAGYLSLPMMDLSTNR